MNGLHISFRTDASLDIGTGHVMRCLTLADALAAAGASCHFYCRAHPGHMLTLIEQRGHRAVSLPEPASDTQTSSAVPHNGPAYAAWLGVDWHTDALQTRSAMAGATSDWLIVDHYALDSRWESALKPLGRRLMVIDDLADRAHVCDLLLDQNLVAGMEQRYLGKVPAHCQCLIGPGYALLRPEFGGLRAASLARRNAPTLQRLLVFMGGTDADNETAKVIAAVQLSKRHWRHIDVVVGQDYPDLQTLQKTLDTMPTAKLHVQTREMAQLMMAADLAITACGSVSWEKCALGLPSIGAILGENQRCIANMLHSLGAQQTLGMASDLTPAAYAQALDTLQTSALSAMIECASSVCDGFGTQKVLKALEPFA